MTYTLISHQSLRACKDGGYCEQDLFLQQWRPCKCVKCPGYTGRDIEASILLSQGQQRGIG